MSLADLALGAKSGPEVVKDVGEAAKAAPDDSDLEAVMDEFRGATSSKEALESLRALVRRLSK